MKHPTVPLLVLALVSIDEDQRQHVAQTCCVRVGNTLEVDTACAELAHPGVGQLLSDYYQASRNLWDDLSRGNSSTPCVQVERILHTERQVDTREERTYLTDTADLLGQIHGLEAASDLLESNPQWTRLRRTGTLKRRKLESTFTMACPARHYPARLGGVRSRSETARYLTVTTSHAGWRDSRARRLTSLTVTAHEIWPDPTKWEKNA